VWCVNPCLLDHVHIFSFTHTLSLSLSLPLYVCLVICVWMCKVALVEHSLPPQRSSSNLAKLDGAEDASVENESEAEQSADDLFEIGANVDELLAAFQTSHLHQENLNVLASVEGGCALFVPVLCVAGAFCRGVPSCLCSPHLLSCV
jgi:hypothetical protein